MNVTPLSRAFARRWAGPLTILGLLLGAGAAAAAPAATTYTVSTTSDTASDANCLPGACSLREAVDAATVNGDRIVLPAGTYSLLNGQLLVSSGITVQGAGAGSTVIQGTPASADRVMEVAGNSSAVTLTGLTITGGDTTSSVADAGGGGIAAFGPGPLVLDQVDVVANTVDTTNTGPGDDQGGGGILTAAALTLHDSSVDDNTVTVPASTGDSGGGGILSTGDDLTLNGSSVSGNTADVTPIPGEGTDNNGGGGLYQDGGDLTVQRSVIDGNTAAVATAPTNINTPADGGGGIYQFGDNFLLADSTVADNVAHGPGEAKGGGGGIFDDGDTSQYLNSTVTGNRTDQAAATTAGFANGDGGGGILLDGLGGGVTMANLTITANSAGPGSGGGVENIVYADAGNAASAVDLSDSILAANDAGNGANCAGPVSSVGYNLSDDLAGDDTCAPSAVGDVLTADPRLGPLGANGGPTPTQALLAGSPAIDAGDPAGCTDLAGQLLTTDQRGAVRPTSGDGRCDVGAYELALPSVATGTATVSGSTVALDATVANPGPEAGTLRFQYGATVAYGSSSAAEPLAGGAGSQIYIVLVPGLSAGTYHFRALATSPDGTSTGTDEVFTVATGGVATTVPAPPSGAGAAPSGGSAATVAALRGRATGAFSAIVSGTVNPGGQVTSYQFEYGTGRRYGSATRMHRLAAGAGTVRVSARLTGLHPGRVYRYRLVAVNSAGTVEASSRRLRTARKPAPRALSVHVAPGVHPDPPYVYEVSGRLSAPAGTDLATACRGMVTVRAYARGIKVGMARATLSRGCRYQARLRLTVTPPTTTGRARVDVRFAGNPSLRGRSAAPRVVTFGR